MRSKMFLGVVAVLAAMAALAAAATAAAQTPPSPPPTVTYAPFTAWTLLSGGYPNGKLTIRVQIHDTVTDNGWAPFAMKIANKTNRMYRFTKTALAWSLDGRGYVWSQTAELTGGFGWSDPGQWWIRTGRLSPGRSIIITGKVRMPSRANFSRNDPRRDATVACLQAMLRIVTPGQPGAQRDVPSTMGRHACGQFAAVS